MPYASSWLERLRRIKRLRRTLETNRNESMSSGGGGGGGMGGMSDHHHHMHQQSGGGGSVSPQVLARKYQMDDFTNYTQ